MPENKEKNKVKAKKKKAKKDPRFVIKEDQSMGLGMIGVLVDSKTGVNYIMTMGSSPEFITPLLGSDGKVVIDKK